MTSSNHFQAVAVSYHTSPSPDLWERIQADLHRQLPLKNLLWKSTTSSVRTINQVHLHFQSLYPSESATNLISSTPEAKTPSLRVTHQSSSPLLHMLFVACDDNEAYRTIVKQEIRTWLDFVQSLPISEWLIVHVTAAAKVNAGGIFRTKAGVLDKIRADFNPPKKDRCIQLSYSGGPNPSDPTSHDLTQWQELVSRLKDGLLEAFDASIGEMEESVRGLDSKRGSPEWGFGTFFAEKANLANRYGSMSLFEDCLLQYEELDASLFQHLRDSPADWAEKVGGTEHGDDSRSILRHDAKEYLQLVASGDISIFDLRIYIFAQHTKLLGLLDRLEEAIGRANTFITTFAAFLRQHQTSLIRYFVESWTYSACIDLVSWCESQITGKDLPTMQLNGVLRLCAQLLELAHNQLNKLGIYAEYLPCAHPFSMAIPSFTSSNPQEVGKTHGSITRAELEAALHDKGAFEKLYVGLTNRAIHMYQKSGRTRSALKLHLALAAFEQIRARDQQAQRLFAHLPAHYVDDKWTIIESSLLDRCATLQSRLGMGKEWLLSTLALVRSGVTSQPGRWSQDVMLRDGQMDTIALATRLIKNIKEQASKLEKDFAAISFPTFVVAVVGDTGRSADPKEGSIVSARVTNLLPCPVDVDTLRMKFSSVRYETLWFTAEAQTLIPGDTVVDLYCPTPVAETLVLEISQVRICRIIFQYPHRPPYTVASSKSSGIPKALAQISFAKDPLALDVNLQNPQDIYMSSNRLCLFTLFSGRNRLAKANISFSSEGRVTFLLKHCKALNERTFKINMPLDLQSNENMMELRNVEPNTKITISIPFMATTMEPHTSVLVNVDHYIDAGEEVRRSFRKSCTLTIALPLIVNVQDFVRPDCIVSKFSVAADGKNPIRILSADLDIPSPFSIIPARSVKNEATLVMVSQTAHFLFKLVPPEAPHPESPTMKLVLKYRLLIDEMLDILRSELARLLDHVPRQKSLLPSLLTSLRSYLEEIGPNHAYQHYSIHRQLKLGTFDALHWDRVCYEFEKADSSRTHLVDALRSMFEVEFVRAAELATPWHTLTIPVELPNVSVLNTMSFRLASEKVDAQVGKPLTFDLVIKTSFRWCGSPEVFERLNREPPKQVYELLPNFGDWLISGPTCGEFLARDDGKTVIGLSLVPMRYGEICLPEVAISSSDTTSDLTTETHHLNRAESIMIYPSPTASSRYFIYDSDFELKSSPIEAPDGWNVELLGT
ncbi:hypothetical protein CROQUDRAFT_42270 [Cronartium quercuum f. sp. fusiforme G11]|uniref:Trafficking protein particle complex subunit 10 n=1 Tax=Cronartium quercuum f. sp. fusiforme G11 TaxID=708437 RepID=A0A9P6NLQ1_9BASI|nr:hypothetical protein CROQUDRAFT_42270 [Cronartium quercuum f. sp. fusiforme G11]